MLYGIFLEIHKALYYPLLLCHSRVKVRLKKSAFSGISGLPHQTRRANSTRQL